MKRRLARHDGERPLINTLSPSEQQLLALCRCNLEDPETPALPDRVDWNALVASARRRGLSSLLYLALYKRFATLCPSWVMQALQTSYRSNSAFTLRVLLEGARLSERMARRGVEATFIKGAVFGRTIWRDLNVRQSCDLDLLVPADKLSTANEVLVETGYVAAPVSATEAWVNARSGHAVVYQAANNPVAIDLHWRFSGGLLSGISERLMRRLATTHLSLQEGDFRTPSREDSVHLLALHETKNFWSRWIALYDLARIVELNRDEQWWRTVLTQAFDLGTHRMLLLGLYLVAETLAVRLPPYLQTRVDDDACLVELAQLVAKIWQSGLPPSRWQEARFLLQAHERTQHRARALFSYALEPGEAEARLITLPVGSRGLYYLVRAFRLGALGVEGLASAVRCGPLPGDAGCDAGVSSGRHLAPDRLRGERDRMDELDLPPRLEMLGTWIQAFTLPQLMRHLSTPPRQARIAAYHNAHTLYLAQQSEELRAHYARAHTCHAEGMGAVVAARLLGLPLTRQHRVANLDLLPPLLASAEALGQPVFFLGGEPQAAASGLARLQAAYPRLPLAGHHGYFSPAEEPAILQRIVTHGTHLLFLGLGTPRQEAWAVRHLSSLGPTHVVLCGSLIRYQAGEVATPPRALGPLGLEWAWRLATEPRRLWFRYLIEPWCVLRAVIREAWRREAVRE